MGQGSGYRTVLFVFADPTAERHKGGFAHGCAPTGKRLRAYFLVKRNSFRFSRLFAELHRDSLYPMMGKDAWVAGADRREAPGPKPVRLGRRLWLRRQPPGSWQLWNGGVQRGVSCSPA